MKKKALERIPLQTPEADCDAKAWIHEEYLVIDIREEDLRIVLGEKEYANSRRTEDGGWIWSGENVENLHLPEVTVMPEEEEKMVLDWIRKRKKFWQLFGDWETAVREMEERIRRDKRNRAAELQRERLKARDESMPPVPEDFPKWVESCFGPSFLFYHRTNRRRAQVYCGKCGGSVEYVFRRRDTFEGQFEKIWEEPERGKQGTCMICGEKGIYKSDKRKSVLCRDGYAYIIQKYEDGIVLRKFLCERHSAAGRKDSFIQMEEGRAFYLPDRKLIDYRYTDNWTGATEWHDHNMPGMANIIWQKGTIWPGSFEELKGTKYQYSGLQEYYGWHNMISPKKYIDTYNQAKALEYLVKVRAGKLVEHILVYGPKSINPWGRNASEVLRLPGGEARRFLQEDGDDRQLDLMQRTAANGWKIDLRTEKDLLRTEVEIYRIAIALRWMGARKFLNHLMKYAGIDELYSRKAIERIKETAVIYTDYLSMRAALGYDMTDTVILFPRDLQAAHHQMAVLQNERQAEIEVEKKEAAYGQGIRERFADAMKRYGWEDGEKMIRPAESAGEIVQEGRELHHCVGGDVYLSRHEKGESTILFLRKKEEPDIPYVTVEVIGKIINQWYGAYNRKTDKEENEKWLKNYVNVLQRRAV